MSLSNIERLVVSSKMLTDGSFLESVKYAQSGCGSIECLAEGFAPDGLHYFKKNLDVMAIDSYIASSLNPKYLSSSTLAIGLNLKDLSDNINDPKLAGLPIMLISDKNCHICFIEFDLSKEPPITKFVCRKRDECKINEQFCSKVMEKDSVLNDKAQTIAKTINRSNGGKSGIIPFFKYSVFVDYLVWELHFKKGLEKQWNKHYQELRDKYNNNLGMFT